MTALDTTRGILTDRGAARRLMIIETTAHLFDERGYCQVTVDEIAVAVGLAKGTLYHYFKSKSEILYEIHRQFIFPLLEKARERSQSDIPASEELRGYIRDVLCFFGEKPSHMRVFSEHLRDLDPDQHADVVADRDEYRAIIKRAIQRGVDSGEFAEMDSNLAALTFLGAMNWSYHWFRPGGAQSAAEVADALWIRLLLGLAPRLRGTPQPVTGGTDECA